MYDESELASEQAGGRENLSDRHHKQLSIIKAVIVVKKITVNIPEPTLILTAR